MNYVWPWCWLTTDYEKAWPSHYTYLHQFRIYSDFGRIYAIALFFHNSWRSSTEVHKTVQIKQLSDAGRSVWGLRGALQDQLRGLWLLMDWKSNRSQEEVRAVYWRHRESRYRQEYLRDWKEKEHESLEFFCF